MIGVFGQGRHRAALEGHGAPLGGFVFDTDRDVSGVLVLEAGQVGLIEASLRAGRVVLAVPPVVTNAGELARLRAAALEGGGRLLAGGEIAHSEAGRRGLAAMAAPAFGKLHSIYIAIRRARGGAGVEGMLAEAVDFALAAMPGAVVQVRRNVGALFGAELDTAVLLLRSDQEVVATIEVSHCLPAGMGEMEIEIEAMGAQQSVRITPGSDAVEIWGDHTRRLVPWLNAPVLEMLRAVEKGEGADGLERAAALLAVLEG
jgi:predicted dehydrogenase